MNAYNPASCRYSSQWRADNAKSKNDPEFKKFYAEVDRKVTWGSELEMSQSEFDDEVFDSYSKNMSISDTVKMFKQLRDESSGGRDDRYMRSPHD